MISLCIATFSRPDRLETLLDHLVDQTYKDFEVVISDNDPQGSAERVINLPNLSKLRINYQRNETNVGMVKNFNLSLSRATGEYIIFITDDDPLFPHALETLVSLASQYPGFACYYGGAGTLVETEESALENGIAIGFHPELGACIEGDVRCYSPQEAFDAVLKGSIFPNLLWSAGMIERKVAIKIGGMPDYGSPHMADHIYMALAGLEGGLAVINKVLAARVIHTSNYSKMGGEILADVALRARDFAVNHPSLNNFGPEGIRQFREYIGGWTLSYILWLQTIAKTDPSVAKSIAEQVNALKRLPEFKKLYPRYLARTYTPWVGRFRQSLRRWKGRNLRC